MRPADAHLTFSERRFAGLDLTLARAELLQRANGAHIRLEDALAYARREGPAVVLTPAGEVIRVDRERDAAEDARLAAQQTETAERLCWTIARREPGFRPL